jgi:hypothetical protein
MRFLIAGKCRYCGCTESSPCTLQDGDTCGWHDNTRTVCSGPACMRQFAADSLRAKQGRRKRTPADVHAEIMQRNRGRRSKRAA